MQKIANLLQKLRVSSLLLLICAVLYLSSYNKLNLYSLPNQKNYLQNVNQSDIVFSPDSNLASNVENILDNKWLNKTDYGICIYSFKKDAFVYLKNSELPLTPASTTKLLTSFCNLSLKTSGFKIRTSLYSDFKPDSSGVIKGNIYLVGRGDAVLNDYDIDLLADLIKKRNIKKITGNLYVDESYFDGINYRRVYSGDGEEVQPTGTINSISINKNQARIDVLGGGEEVAVKVTPESEYFQKVNNAFIARAKKSPAKREFVSKKGSKAKSNKQIASKKGSKSKVTATKSKATKKKHRASIEMANDINQKYGDKFNFVSLLSNISAAGLSVSSSSNGSGKQSIFVKGSVAPNKNYSYYYPIKDPALAAGGCLAAKLKKRGIIIEGEIKAGKLKDGIASYNSFNLIGEFQRPIGDFIKLINKYSDNYLAEHLFKINGAEYGVSPNNAQSAYSLIQKVMVDNLMNFENCSINDGSGLSRRNKLTTQILTKLLVQSREKEFSAVLDSSLSIAAVDGTLHKRMRGTYAAGNLHAKTGTLRNASGLTGFVKSRSGDEYAFAFLFNGPNVGFYKQIEDKLGILLSEWK